MEKIKIAKSVVAGAALTAAGWMMEGWMIESILGQHYFLTYQNLKSLYRKYPDINPTFSLLYIVNHFFGLGALRNCKYFFENS